MVRIPPPPDDWSADDLLIEQSMLTQRHPEHGRSDSVEGNCPKCFHTRHRNWQCHALFASSGVRCPCKPEAGRTQE